MTDAVLYTSPGTCGRVTAIALYEADVVFEPHLIRFKIGEHRLEQHLARNPLGKVPVLEIDGTYLTENVAILLYLAARYPEAKLLPAVDGPIARARQVADLCFCSSTLHPIVTRIRIPNLFAEGDEAASSVYQRAISEMTKYLGVAEKRLGEGPWWYGRNWSVVDGYLFWVWFRITGAGFDPRPFPHLADHAGRMAERPAVKKALILEDALFEQLAAEGMSFNPTMMARS